MKNKKIFFTVSILVFSLAVASSFYSSGAALLMSINQPITSESLSWNTFIETYSYYGNDNSYSKYINIGLLGAVAPLFFALFLTVILFLSLRDKTSVHGDARMANDKDLSNSGFFPTKKTKKKSTAVLIGKIPKGKHKGQFLQYIGQQFLMLYAPTRSGKGVSIVIVNCLYYQESLVVLDIKLENFIFTAGHREKNLGQDVFLFCPDGYADQQDITDRKLRTHRYNPLFYIRRDPVHKFGDLSKISAIMFPTSGGDNDMWTDLSANVFNAIVLYLLDCEHETVTEVEAIEKDGLITELHNEVAKYKVTMSQVYKLSIPEDGSGLGEWFLSEIEKRNTPQNIKDWKSYSEGRVDVKPKLSLLSDDTVMLMRQFASQKDEQQQSIMLTFNSNMKVFSNPITAAATDGNDFDLRELRRKKMTVYYGLAPSAISTFERLTNLFFSQLLSENTRTLPEHDDTLKYQCLLMLDEFTSMGKLEIIQTSLAFTAGYNIRFVFILQNQEQLFDDKKGYGKNGGSTILKNCAVEIVFPSKEVDEATKNLSETIGYYDLKQKKKSRSSGKSSSTSTSEDTQKRAIMLPQEIVELRDIKHKSGISLKQIIMSEFCRPLLADKIIYFEEPFFLDRKEFSENNIPNIPLIEVEQNAVAKRLFEISQEEDKKYVQH